MTENNYSIYVHVFPNEKMYVGITSLRPTERWGHNGAGYSRQPLMRNAIEKYGWDNVHHCVLLSGLSREEAEFLETEMIEAYGTVDRRFGYNLQPGGGLHGKHSVETIEKMRRLSTGRKQSDRAREKKRSALLGRTFSKETRAKMRSAKQNKMRSVQCVETGEVFNALIDASRALNIHVGSISRVIDNPCRVASGYHFITPKGDNYAVQSD